MDHNIQTKLPIFYPSNEEVMEILLKNKSKMAISPSEKVKLPVVRIALIIKALVYLRSNKIEKGTSSGKVYITLQEISDWMAKYNYDIPKEEIDLALEQLYIAGAVRKICSDPDLQNILGWNWRVE